MMNREFIEKAIEGAIEKAQPLREAVDKALGAIPYGTGRGTDAEFAHFWNVRVQEYGPELWLALLDDKDTDGGREMLEKARNLGLVIRIGRE